MQSGIFKNTYEKFPLCEGTEKGQQRGERTQEGRPEKVGVDRPKQNLSEGSEVP